MVERFARILAAMLQAGVTLPEAMDVASAGTNNRYVRRTLANARDAMMRGEGIADPLAASQLFPPAATQMLRVGERTGYLDAQLEAVATFYERELDYRIKKLTSLFEPAVLIFMGVIVGFVALALVSAMYGIYRTGTP
jgi:type IV pilus assembly protein PilC